MSEDVQAVVDKAKRPVEPPPATAKTARQAFDRLEKKRKQLSQAQKARTKLHIRKVVPQMRLALALEPSSLFQRMASRPKDGDLLYARGFATIDYVIHQWTHSILEERSFLPEWKANIRSLDLAFEVLDDCQWPTSSTPSCRRPSRSRTMLNVPFGDQVGLYVVSEHDLLFPECGAKGSR